MSAERFQDYIAATREIHSNVEIRRLMFVFIHVLLPGGVMATADCIAGEHYAEQLAWWPRIAIPLVGLLIATSGFAVCVVLSRCHFGMVLNSMKIHAVLSGSCTPQSLNWRGVTTNFIVLTALSAAGGAVYFLAVFLPIPAALTAGVVFWVVTFAWLPWNHRRANQLGLKLAGNWQRAEITPALREEHTIRSLADANADVAIVVTMAAALFVGLFSAMAGVGSVNGGLGIDERLLVLWSLPAFAGFLTVSLLLSARMVARLRRAIGDMSVDLSRLRNEPDDPWRFKPFERTFLLFLLVELLVGFSAAILLWTFLGGAGAAFCGCVLIALGVTGYHAALLAGRRLHHSPPAAASATGR